MLKKLFSTFSFLLAFVSIPVSAISFLGFWTGKGILPLPKRPPEHKIVWEDGRSFWHNLKNQLTEWVRENPKWFGKFFSFIVLAEFILIWVT